MVAIPVKWNVCNEFLQTTGIFTFYTEATEISHNDILNLPYSGISEGTGWNNANDNITQKNNKINYNRIVSVMNVLHDGGGIYTLGYHGGSNECRYNYIKDVNNAYGSIYHDEGSSNYSTNNNVIENTAMYWLHIWTSSIHDIAVDNNYTNNSNYDNSGTNCTVTNTHVESGSPWSSAAQSIINNSGLEAAYQYWRTPTPLPETSIALNKTVTISGGNTGFYLTDGSVSGGSTNKWYGTTTGGANLLTNSGLESGAISPWSTSAHWSVSSEDKNAGMYSLKLTGTGDDCSVTQTVSVSQNTNYVYTFYAKAQRTQWCKVLTTGSSTLAEQQTIANNTWTKYTLTFNSGSNLSVILYLGDNGGQANTVYFDDFLLTQ